MRFTTFGGRRGRAVLLLALAMACGCGTDGDRAGIKGKVTVDGQPLLAGSIAFDPIEGTESPNAGAVVTNGAYEVAQAKGPKPGVYSVKIQGLRRTGKKVEAGPPTAPGTMIDEEVPAVSAQHNAKSALRVELKAGANPATDFDLKSK